MWSFGGSNNPATLTAQPPLIEPSTSSASSATTVSTHEHGSSNNLIYTYKVQIFPHRENAQILGAIPGQAPAQRFHFEPIERDLKQGMMLKIGRKVDKKPPPAPLAPIEDDNAAIAEAEAIIAANEVPVLPASYQSTSGFLDQPRRPAGEQSTAVTALTPAAPTTTATLPAEKMEQPQIDFIAFKSKVVSRAHAELWVSEEGQVMFKDVGSSSGTWVNRHRLSPSGKESRPYNIKSGDVIQLGMDYQGRQEDMYKSVVMKVFVTIRSKDPPKPNPLRLKHALRALLSAMNPTSQSASSTSCTDCCICLSPLSPLQTLFLAPCSHCFHFRCVMPLLGSSVMFQCPLCRQVANLEKGVGEDEESLFDGENGSGGEAVLGENSLEEWLGVLRVGAAANGGASGTPAIAGPSAIAPVVEVEGSEDNNEEQNVEEIVYDLQGVLGEVAPGLDDLQKAELLERFRIVLEGKK
ncbi:UNVERIFIED_CONTAM: hypothetical protein HDU68_002298 [Siphonaria sp. JEL0065]|nr:hypothetical protein HDU68_002298 [Siphonaria sp. JEL0065]